MADITNLTLKAHGAEFRVVVKDGDDSIGLIVTDMPAEMIEGLEPVWMAPNTAVVLARALLGAAEDTHG